MRYTLTMALSGNVSKNKDFRLRFNLYENWNKTSLTAKSFGDIMFVHRICRNRCTDLQFRQFHISISTTSTKELEVAGFQVFTKNRLLSGLIDSLSFCFLTTHVENVSRSIILNSADYFLWIRRFFFRPVFETIVQ